MSTFPPRNPVLSLPGSSVARALGGPGARCASEPLNTLCRKYSGLCFYDRLPSLLFYKYKEVCHCGKHFRNLEMQTIEKNVNTYAYASITVIAAFHTGHFLECMLHVLTIRL